MELTRAFLIRKYRLSETSLILVWLTQEHGKIKTAAQGALKRESPFYAAFELFKEVELSFLWSKKSDLHLLKEAAPILPQPPLKSDYITLLSASYFAELCDLFVEPCQAVPEVFDLLQRAFHFLSKNTSSHLAIEHFEKELAKALGIYNPVLPAALSLSTVVKHLPASRKKLFDQLTLNIAPVQK